MMCSSARGLGGTGRPAGDRPGGGSGRPAGRDPATASPRHLSALMPRSDCLRRAAALSQALPVSLTVKPWGPVPPGPRPASTVTARIHCAGQSLPESVTEIARAVVTVTVPVTAARQAAHCGWSGRRGR
jgi:hypothetical protein